jgi:8-oxo-dGTP pyrophosphatase MutT (NUDIX family)
MIIKPWKILSSTCLQGNIRLDRCQLPSGLCIEKPILEYGNWVTVLALTENMEGVLIHQYRHGIQKIILELPGGMVDEGESPSEAARRELLEETGYHSERIVQIGCVSPNPDNHTNLIYSFLALDAKMVAAQRLDATEEINVVLKPLDDLIALAGSGGLLQSMQVSTLFFALVYLKRIA